MLSNFPFPSRLLSHFEDATRILCFRKHTHTHTRAAQRGKTRNSGQIVMGLVTKEVQYTVVHISCTLVPPQPKADKFRQRGRGQKIQKI